jgi:hypothetical protein
MTDDASIKHYVVTVAMSDLDFVSKHIIQIGRIMMENRREIDYWPGEIRQDPMEREHYYPHQWSRDGKKHLSHVQRIMSPEYYNEVFELYKRWDRIGRRQEQKEYKEFLELEKQWQECWKIEKEACNALL